MLDSTTFPVPGRSVRTRRGHGILPFAWRSSTSELGGSPTLQRFPASLASSVVRTRSRQPFQLSLLPEATFVVR